MEKHKKIINILRNFSFLTAGRIAGDLFIFLLFVALSREYGQEGIGKYSFAMGLAGFFMVMSNFGLYFFTLKKLEVNSSEIQKVFGEIFTLRIILSIIVFCILLGFVMVTDYSDETGMIIFILGIYNILYVLIEGISAVYITQESTSSAVIIEVSVKALTAIIGILLIILDASLVVVITGFPIVSLLVLFVAYRSLSIKYGAPVIGVKIGHVKNIAKEAAPYAISSFLRQVSTRSDVVILGFLLGVASVGVYNVAYRVVFFIMFLAHFAGVVLMPITKESYAKSKGEFRKLYGNVFNLIILVGVPLSAGLWLISPGLIGFVFGEEFSESVTILKYLSILLMLGFMKSILGVFMISSNIEKKWAKSWWWAAVINVLGNIALITIYGIKGAAIATIISDLALVALFIYYLSESAGYPMILRRLVISSIATSAFCFLFAFYSSTNILIMIPVSMVIYVGMLLLFRDIRDVELVFVKKMIGTKLAS